MNILLQLLDQSLYLLPVTYVYIGHNLKYGYLVGCSGFNGPLRQYFSLYQAVSQREGERGEKG